MSVSADVSQATAGLNSLSNQLNRTSSSFQQAAPAALLFEAAGATVFGAIGEGVKVAADFEQQMANVRSVMDPKEAQVFGGAIEELALSLGRDTVFTSKQAGSAIEELTKAGVPVADILNGAAAAALNLAAATGVSTTQAATVAAQALNQFGLKGSDATRVVDRLTSVANKSSADISFLQLALAQAGGVAAGFGLTLDDTASILGALSPRFASGSDEGTSFKVFMERLIPTTKSATKEMASLGLLTAQGVPVFFDAAGKLKDMAQVAGLLHNALVKLTPEQRLQALQTIFGTDAIRAAIGIYDLGAKGVSDFEDATGAAGVAQDQARERLNTLEGAMNNLGGSIETVQILVGKTFTPILRQVADTARGIVDAFGKLDPAVRSGIVNFLLVGATLLTAIGTFILFAPAISAIVPALLAVGGVLAALAIPALAIAGVFLTLKRIWEQNLGPVQAIKDAFGNIGDIILAAFSGDIGGAVNGFLEDLSTLSPDIRNIITNIKSTISNLITSVGPVLSVLGAAFDQAFQGNFGGALDILQGLAGTISPVLGDLVGKGRELAGAFGPALAGAFQTVSGFLREQAESLWPKLLEATQGVQAFWDSVFRPALDNIGLAVDASKPKLAELKQAFLDVVQPPAVNFFNLVLDTLNKMESQAASGGSGGGPIGQFFSGLGTSIQEFGGKLASLSPIFTALTNLFGALANLAGSVVQLAGLGPVFAALGLALAPFAALLAPFVIPFRLFVELVERLAAAPDAVNAIAGGIQGIADAVNNFATALQKVATVGIPAFLQDLLGGTATGGGAGGFGPAAPAPATPSGPGIGGPNISGEGPLIGIGQLIISSEAEATAFLDRMGQAIAAAAKRAAPPVDNAATPALAPGT